jgi:hypothetical protein
MEASMSDSFNDQGCDVCGKLPDDCLCPECPICHEVGRIECYQMNGHWPALVLNKAQILSRIETQIALLKERIADLEMYYSWGAEQEKLEESNPRSVWFR